MNTPHRTTSGTAEDLQSSRDELEYRIEQTREDVLRTLEALKSKLSPRQRLDAAVNSVRLGGRQLMKDSLNAVSPSITTLIRMDHAHVLALFRRFKPYTSPGRKRALAANACLALEIHAQLEEEILYPALREVVPSNPALAKSVPEHDNIRKRIETVRSLEPGDADFADAFRTLIREVLHHVADEETTLLPLADALLTDQLGALGAHMTRRRLQLLAPHAREVASTSIRSFPVLLSAAAAGMVLLGWLAIRPRRTSAR